MARRRFFVDEVHEGRAQMSGEAAHHLSRVLRVEPGQKFELSDNRNVYLAQIETVAKNLVSFAVLDQLVAVEPPVRVLLFASLIRFERFERMLEKATELGVESITPVQAERSEKGLEHAAEKRVERWRKIVREASEQSRRARLPEVHAPNRLAEVLSAATGFFLDEDPEAAPIAIPADRSEVALLVGPEGGWTDQERALAVERGWSAVSLGNTILRTETAAIAGIAIINGLTRLSPRARL